MHLYSHLVSNHVSLANPSSWGELTEGSLRQRAGELCPAASGRDWADSTGSIGATHLVGNGHPQFVGHIRVYIYIMIYIYIYVCKCMCVCVLWM